MPTPRETRVQQRRHELARMTVQEHIDAAARCDAEHPSSVDYAAARCDAEHPSSVDYAAAWHLSVIKHLMWAQTKAAGGFPRPHDLDQEQPCH